MGMTTPHPQPDSPPPDVAQLQARIAELEAENVTMRDAWKNNRQTDVSIVNDESLAEFQKYEKLTANWLRGEVAPAFTAGFDIWKCAFAPQLKIQVKYSNVYHFGGTARRHMTKTWTFHQSKWSEAIDYFVLFGIAEDRGSHCFALRADTFIEHSANSHTKGGRIMVVSPNRFVRRGGVRKGYLYEPFIWKYEVSNPATNLEKRITELESWKQMQIV